MRDPTFIEENKKVIDTVATLSSAKEDLEKRMEELGAHNLEKLKELRENPATNSADFLQFLQLLDEKNAALNLPDKYKLLEELDYLKTEPFFSRVDILDHKNSKEVTHYIGKFGYSINENPIIIDWRAKVASVYYKYRYPQKDIVYDTPDGEIKADLKLKRTFEIQDGELIKYYNNDIHLNESEIIVDKMSKRTGGVLEDIVETIQEDQHEIIESDPRRVCIVQGTVGSGKSTVAIHKLSHVFFNYPELINPTKTMLVAKNEILVGYLSTLFPKLGIFDINFGTIRNLVYKILFKEKINVDFDLDKNRDTFSFGIDGISSLRNEIKEIHNGCSNEVAKIFDSPKYESFGGFVYDDSLPVYQNLTEAIKDLEEENRYQKKYIKENPNSTRGEVFAQNIKIMKKIVRKLSGIRSKIMSKSMPRLAGMFCKDSSPYGYLDTIIYLVIYSELRGFSNTSPYEYCVVDEGQDFSVLEYLLLDKTVSNGRFCILGDLNQSYDDVGISKWEDIYEVISGAKHAKEFVLEKNYRSTKQIVEFANEILRPYTKNYLPISINRIGSDVKIKRFSRINDVYDEITKSLEEDTRNLNKSVGIICLNDDYLANICKILENLNIPSDLIIKMQEKQRISYLPKAIYLTNVENCKGLEFGKVYVVGLDTSDIRDFNEAKKAFVTVTRAMDELVIYTIDEENTKKH